MLHSPSRSNQSSDAIGRRETAPPQSPPSSCIQRHSFRRRCVAGIFPHSAAAAARRTHFGRRADCPVRRRRRAVLRRLRHRSPADSVLHHPDGSLRRAQDEMDRPELREHASGSENRGGSNSRRNWGGGGEPGGRGNGEDAGRRAAPGGSAAELQGRGGRDNANVEAGGNR